MPVLRKFSILSYQFSVTILILLSTVLWVLSTAPAAQAACYCQDPSQCRCSTRAPASAKNEGAIGGIAVFCDTEAEASSQDAVRAPICGSSPEVIPKCAKGADGNPGFLICWGSSVATGTTSLSPLPGPHQSQTYTPPVPFQYNGETYGIVGTNYVTICSDNLTCCSDNTSNCFPADIPQTPSSCPDQNPSAVPPASLCGVVSQPAVNFQGRSDTDARIFFPHVKNTSAITYLLQSMFRPISWSVDKIKDYVVYSKLYLTQGKSDLPQPIPVINVNDNNSSVIPGQPAPSPPFLFHDTYSPVQTDAFCSIEDVRVNPGDDLLGKKIYSTLTYTQKFEYDLLTCQRYTGNSTNEFGTGCCPGASPRCQTDPRTGKKFGCVCGPVNNSLPTKGRVLVYTKSPFLEYLYQNLVAGPMAIYKRFISQDAAADIKDIPTKSAIKVTSNAKSISYAATPPTSRPAAEIYFPHLGSIYDYFLKNLQKLLRPKGTGDTTSFNPDPNYIPGTLACATPLVNCPDVNWNDPIYSAFDRAYQNKPPSFQSLVKQSWAQQLISNSGLCPKFLATLWIEESGGSAIANYDMGCVYNFDTKQKTETNTHPTNMTPIQLQAYQEKILKEQIECVKSYVNAIGNDFQTFMCQYSGETDTDPNKPFRQCTTFTNNPNFPVNFCKYLDGTTSVPPGSGSITTPTTYCSTHPNGLFRSGNICIKCRADGLVESKVVCKE